jgi:ribonuclease VapC
VIFVDTSAIVAMLAAEREGPAFADTLEQSRERITAGHVLLEASMRLSTLLGLAPTVADSLVTRLLRETGIEVVPIDEETAHLAVEAFERYGKGRGHAASLNFGDCLSYACAKAHGAKLMYKGKDFTKTDIVRA